MPMHCLFFQLAERTVGGSSWEETLNKQHGAPDPSACRQVVGAGSGRGLCPVVTRGAEQLPAASRKEVKRYHTLATSGRTGVCPPTGTAVVQGTVLWWLYLVH